MIIKADDQVPGHGFSEHGVTVMGVGPCCFPVFYARTPRRPEDIADLQAGGLADADPGYGVDTKFMADREAPGGGDGQKQNDEDCKDSRLSILDHGFLLSGPIRKYDRIRACLCHCRQVP